MKIKELLRKIPGPINLYGILRNNFLFDPKRRGFHGDRIYQGIIEQIISSLPVTSFIETGTYVGNSTAYVAAKNETLPVLSCENDKRFYRKSVKRLKKFKNVKIYLKSSEQFIEQILGESQIGNLPFFFLDAHWYKYWPLEDEIRLISKSAISTIIIIDDFKVPQQSHFSFDAQEDS
jgi:predicted O-methyltransferase YrrM